MILTGRTAIVTGAASGIGRAIAVRFAGAGARVIVADVTETPREGGAPTAAVIGEAGGEAWFRPCDVTRWEAIDAVVGETVQRFGRLDVMVNNAMVTSFQPAPLLACSEEQWRRTLDVNLTGVFFGCKRAVQQMRSQEPLGEVRGRIINLASQFGFVAPPGNCAYAVSKAAIVQLTRSVAKDYAAELIVCNGIAPGKVMTGKGGQPELPEVVAFSQSRTPWPRLGRPGDIAAAALFLASDDASFIQGETLAVDGGWLAA
ncbi:MAG: SDR family oxidoreductase [Geminicoccaceae bacterium]|nr:MAG: SDR family oxidoreductase [Geminicoccaceae bacterium]